MNGSNKFTELAIGHHLALGQVAKELIEINRKIEQVEVKKKSKSKDLGSKFLNLFIKFLAYTS